MGNHEFCEECHENDFHLHRPCDPQKVLIVKQAKEKSNLEKQERIGKMKAILNKLGVRFELTEHGDALISNWQFQDDLKKGGE